MREGCAGVEPLLSSLLDGALGPEERRLVQAHVAACAACSDDVESLGRARALVRSLPVRAVPPALLAVLRPLAPVSDNSASRAGRAGRTRPAHAGAVRAAAAVALLGGVVGGSAFVLGGAEPPPRRIAAVPLDVYVADHLVGSMGTAVVAPAFAEAPAVSVARPAVVAP